MSTSSIATIKNTNFKAPGLILNEIDSRVVKIRPAATPLDQISRMATPRRAGSMKVDYYSVDTRPGKGEVKAFEAGRDLTDSGTITLAGDMLLEPSETFMVPSAKVDGTDQPAVFYVTRTDRSSGQSSVMQINGSLPVEFGKGATIVRMGRAATELDVQTPQFQSLPRKESNQCQIFKAQIEESTLHRLSNKEVGWSFSDQEEAAVIDMRLGMEKSFLFGAKATVADPEKGEDVSLTSGIWNQTDHTFTYRSADKAVSVMHDMVREAFSSNSGSRRKILIAGSDLIDFLSRQEITKVLGPTQSVAKWGIDFSEIVTKFGKLYVVHSEIFDQCGCSGNGMVIDPDYLTKYTFIPMQAERLELKRSGQRNTDAIVVTEASCLVLRYPAAHTRIIAE